MHVAYYHNLNRFETLIKEYSKDKTPQNKDRIENFLSSLERTHFKFERVGDGGLRKSVKKGLGAIHFHFKRRMKNLCERALTEKSREKECEKVTVTNSPLREKREAEKVDLDWIDSSSPEKKMPREGIDDKPEKSMPLDLLDDWFDDGRPVRATLNNGYLAKKFKDLEESILLPLEPAFRESSTHQHMADLMFSPENAPSSLVFEGFLLNLYTRFQLIYREINPQASEELAKTLLISPKEFKTEILGSAVAALFTEKNFPEYAELASTSIGDPDAQPLLLDILNQVFPL